MKKNKILDLLDFTPLQHGESLVFHTVKDVLKSKSPNQNGYVFSADYSDVRTQWLMECGARYTGITNRLSTDMRVKL